MHSRCTRPAGRAAPRWPRSARRDECANPWRSGASPRRGRQLLLPTPSTCRGTRAAPSRMASTAAPHLSWMFRTFVGWAPRRRAVPRRDTPADHAIGFGDPGACTSPPAQDSRVRRARAVCSKPACASVAPNSSEPRVGAQRQPLADSGMESVGLRSAYGPARPQGCSRLLMDVPVQTTAPASSSRRRRGVRWGIPPRSAQEDVAPVRKAVFWAPRFG